MLLLPFNAIDKMKIFMYDIEGTPFQRAVDFEFLMFRHCNWSV